MILGYNQNSSSPLFRENRLVAANIDEMRESITAAKSPKEEREALMKSIKFEYDGNDNLGNDKEVITEHLKDIADNRRHEVSTVARTEKISPASWDHTTAEGLTNIAVDVANLIPELPQDAFSRTFNQLAKAYDTKYWNVKSVAAVNIDPAYTPDHIGQMYRNPDTYMSDLVKIDPSFVEAWETFSQLKKIAEVNKSAVATVKSEAEYQKTYHATKAWEAVKDFASEMKNKPELAVVAAIFAYGIWKTDGKFKKTLGVFAGIGSGWLIFDALNKKFGWNIDYPWKASVAEASSGTIAQSIAENKDIDTEVAVMAGGLNLYDTLKAYKAAKANNEDSIDPEKAGLRNDHNPETTGRQLFLIMQQMESDYNGKKNTNNFERDLEKIFASNEDMKMEMTLNDFMLNYVEGKESVDVIFEKHALKKFLKRTGLDFYVQGEAPKEGHVVEIMGYPMVVRRNDVKGVYEFFQGSEIAGKFERTSGIDAVLQIQTEAEGNEMLNAKEKLKNTVENLSRQLLANKLAQLEATEQASARKLYTFEKDSNGKPKVEGANGSYTAEIRANGNGLSYYGKVDIETGRLMEVTGLIEPATGADILEWNESKQEEAEKIKTKNYVLRELLKISKEYGLAGIGFMPQTEYKILDLDVDMDAFDYEEVANEGLKNVEAALKEIKNNKPNILSKLDARMIYLGNQDFVRIFTEKYGTVKVAGNKYAVIDYTDSPEEIADDLEKYTNEIV